jgi:hypothetical protein
MVDNVTRRHGDTGTRGHAETTDFTRSPRLRVSASSHTAGQAMTEYILMLLCLTAIGAMIVSGMVGGDSGKGGAVRKMTDKGAAAIAADER